MMFRPARLTCLQQFETGGASLIARTCRDKAEPGVTSLPPGSTEAGSQRNAASGLAHPDTHSFIFAFPSSSFYHRQAHSLEQPNADMSEFFEIPGNPVPENASAGYFAGRKSRKIRYGLFAAEGRPLKGTIILLQGRNECIEKYFETIEDFSRRGFGVATFDWRGQGASDRLLRDRSKGHVRSFDDYVADLEAFFEEIVLPDCRGPFYVVGHSTGATVALMAAPALLNRVQRMMLCVPLLSLKNATLSMSAIGRISSFLYWIGLGRIYMGNGPRPREATPFAGNVLTTDLERYRRNTRLYETYPQLALGGPTVGWIRAACRASQNVRDPDFMNRIQVPILFIAAGADQVVSTRAIETYAQRLKSGSQITIDGARHEVWQEADIYREQLLAAFDAFIPGTDPLI
jgi:lysophospholipase